MLGEKKSVKLDEIWIKAEKHRQASLVGTTILIQDY